jgi:hypothetical protein
MVRTAAECRASFRLPLPPPARAVFLLVGMALGCANLPEVAPGTCGNAVVEPPEDCDTFAPGAGSVCLPRGSIGECHLDCRRGPNGVRRSCPTGWGCDAQNICRKPTGDFQPSPPIKVGGAWSLMAGDFDGDLRDDIVSLEVPDLRGATHLRVHYFDDTGAAAETRAFPKAVVSPAVADLSADGRSDIVFTSDQYGVGLLFGQSDRSWVPETAGSYRFPDSGVRILSVSDTTVEGSTPVVGLTTIAGVSGLYGPDQNGRLLLRGLIRGPVEGLAGDPVSGKLIEDPQTSPCQELVFAFRGAMSFPVVDVCTRDPVTAEVLWRDQATQATVVLDPPAPIDAAPQIADLDGDGHLDVLVGAAGLAYVAYGDGRGLRTAVPYRLPAAANTAGAGGAPEPDEIPMPLAAGDFTGDGKVDFVFPGYLLVSTPAAAGAGVRYVAAHANQAAPWTVARIADMNDNGKADVVAASSGRLGIDFFNGTGTEVLLAFDIPTSGPVARLAVTDLDGDLINDLIFVEAATSDADRDSLMVAFGNLAGPPVAPALVGRIGHIEQLCASTQASVGRLTLIVAYTETEAVTGAQTGVLAFLAGGGDRLPFAPFSLVDVSAGTVFDEATLGVVVGRFSPSSHGDVMAIGLSGNPPDVVQYAFWLLRGLGTSPSPAVRLGGQIDPRLRPLYVKDVLININVTAVAADLDHDGNDEAVWAIPADAGAHCGLVITTANSKGAGDIVVRDTIVIDQPCPRPQIVPVDADGDGAVDLALLTGGPGGPERSLIVLWNDGAGGFSSSDATTVNPAGDSPQQFAVLPAVLGRPFGFAYVTDRAAVLVSAAAGSNPRLFGPPHTLANLEHGSGIVAADVNGDGVMDLALAASGNLSILQARLATP